MILSLHSFKLLLALLCTKMVERHGYDIMCNLSICVATGPYTMNFCILLKLVYNHEIKKHNIFQVEFAKIEIANILWTLNQIKQVGGCLG